MQLCFDSDRHARLTHATFYLFLGQFRLHSWTYSTPMTILATPTRCSLQTLKQEQKKRGRMAAFSTFREWKSLVQKSGFQEFFFFKKNRVRVVQACYLGCWEDHQDLPNQELHRDCQYPTVISILEHSADGNDNQKIAQNSNVVLP